MTYLVKELNNRLFLEYMTHTEMEKMTRKEELERQQVFSGLFIFIKNSYVHTYYVLNVGKAVD